MIHVLYLWMVRGLQLVENFELRCHQYAARKRMKHLGLWSTWVRWSTWVYDFLSATFLNQEDIAGRGNKCKTSVSSCCIHMSHDLIQGIAAYNLEELQSQTVPNMNLSQTWELYHWRWANVPGQSFLDCILQIFSCKRHTRIQPFVVLNTNRKCIDVLDGDIHY